MTDSHSASAPKKGLRFFSLTFDSNTFIFLKSCCGRSCISAPIFRIARAEADAGRNLPVRVRTRTGATLT